MAKKDAQPESTVEHPPKQVDLTKLSQEELKALWFDENRQREYHATNCKALELYIK